MKHTTPFYMELIIRSADNYYETRPDEGQIYVPLYYMWQEGPDDQHFKFDPDSDNCWPAMHEGDYVIPAAGLPSLPFKPPVFDYTYTTYRDFKRVQRKIKCVHVYHMAFMADVPEPYHRYGGATGAKPASRIVSKKYLKSLMDLWSF